jgi:hypothetical protein
MSKRVECPDCGELIDVPAYSGDGVYVKHFCESRLRIVECEETATAIRTLSVVEYGAESDVEDE